MKYETKRFFLILVATFIVIISLDYSIKWARNAYDKHSVMIIIDKIHIGMPEADVAKITKNPCFIDEYDNNNKKITFEYGGYRSLIDRYILDAWLLHPPLSWYERKRMEIAIESGRVSYIGDSRTLIYY
jgi:hypothetical protein